MIDAIGTVLELAENRAEMWRQKSRGENFADLPEFHEADMAESFDLVEIFDAALDEVRRAELIPEENALTAMVINEWYWCADRETKESFDAITGRFGGIANQRSVILDKVAPAIEALYKNLPNPDTIVFDMEIVPGYCCAMIELYIRAPHLADREADIKKEMEL